MVGDRVNCGCGNKECNGGCKARPPFSYDPFTNIWWVDIVGGLRRPVMSYEEVKSIINHTNDLFPALYNNNTKQWLVGPGQRPATLEEAERLENRTKNMPKTVSTNIPPYPTGPEDITNHYFQHVDLPQVIRIGGAGGPVWDQPITIQDYDGLRPAKIVGIHKDGNKVTIEFRLTAVSKPKEVSEWEKKLEQDRISKELQDAVRQHSHRKDDIPYGR